MNNYDIEVAKLARGMESAIKVEQLEELKSLLYAQILISRQMNGLKRLIIYETDDRIVPIVTIPSSSWTERTSPLPTDGYNLIHAVMGLSTETGEISEIILDYLNGHQLDRTHLNVERGDALWYLALFSRIEGLMTLSGCMWQNIRKLWARFRKKKFNKNEAIHRDLETEQKAIDNA